MHGAETIRLVLMRLLSSLLAVCSSLLLVQCNHVLDPSSRPLTNKDSGRVIGERYYQVGGRPMIERRVLVTATPVLETRVYGSSAPKHPILDSWCRACFVRRDHNWFGTAPLP